MKVFIKKLDDNAVIPSYARKGDAGMDLYAVSKSYDNDANVVYGTGLAFEIPAGYMGLVFPRSSNARMDMLLSNSVGIIDSGYRGEVMLKYKKCFTCKHGSIAHDMSAEYNVGDRVGQIVIMPYPSIEFEEKDELSITERGEGGYGSTGV